MRCEVVYSTGVWEGRGEGDIWKEERKLLVWSTDENSLKITTKRSIKGLCMREEGGTEYCNKNTRVILLQHELLVWVEVEEREKLFNCRADVLRLDHHHIASTVAVKIKLQFLFRSTYN